jgi:hypothetical protein
LKGVPIATKKNPHQLLTLFDCLTLAPDWSHDHNNGLFGTSNSCGTMDHTARTGEDVACLGGLNQHQSFGFTSADQAYTVSS